MKVRLAAAGLLLILAACSISPATPPGTPSDLDWPMFRGDLVRDGHPPGATLTAARAASLRVRWGQPTAGAIDGTPVVAGNTVFVGTEAGTVATFNLKTGAPIWTFSALGQITGTPAVSGGIVVFGTTSGHMYAVRVSDGRQMWDWRAPGEQPAIWSSPAISAGRVLVGLASPYGDSPLMPGGVAALDLETGRQLWILCTMPNCAAGGGVWSSVALDAGGHGFVGVGNPVDGVMAFELAGGKAMWTTSFHEDAGRDLDVGATPIVFDQGGREEIAVGSNAGVFEVLDAATGAVIWSRFLVPGSAVHGLIASPAFGGNQVYQGFASAPTGMSAISPVDGQIVWQRLTELPIYSAPALGVDVLVFGTGDVFGDANAGRLMALASRDGAVLFSFDMHSSVFSSPAISGDLVVVGDSKGILRAFGPS